MGYQDFAKYEGCIRSPGVTEGRGEGAGEIEAPDGVRRCHEMLVGTDFPELPAATAAATLAATPPPAAAAAAPALPA